MSFVLTKKLPTPMEIKELYPVSAELAALKAAKDQELIDIITGASDKFMVIIGPCSADNEEAVCDYISKMCIRDRYGSALYVFCRNWNGWHQSHRQDSSGLFLHTFH